MWTAGHISPVAITASLLILLAAGCAPDDDQSATPVGQQKAEPSESALRPDRVPLIEGPVSSNGFKAILGTADLAIGPNRVGFVVVSKDGFATAPSATVFSRRYDSEASEGTLREITSAKYHPWPYGNRGLYTTQLDFDRAGRWGLDIAVEGRDGALQNVRIFFEVAEVTSAPAEGSVAPKSISKTLDSVQSIAQLATGSLHDPDLYRTTIAEAAESGMPTVVVFASPAFCTNAVCGPQVEVLQQLKDSYTGQANFIHVDFYDNPDEIQGDLGLARISPTVLEWRLPNNEWTFVIDSEGIVSSRFEAFATFAEVEEALRRVL